MATVRYIATGVNPDALQGGPYNEGDEIDVSSWTSRYLQRMLDRGLVAMDDEDAEALPDTVVHSNDIDNIVQMTQAAYDALPSPDARTLYVIVG